MFPKVPKLGVVLEAEPKGDGCCCVVFVEPNVGLPAVEVEPNRDGCCC